MRKYLWLGVLVLAFCIGYGAVAEAWPIWNRNPYRGYFTNVYDDHGAYVLPPKYNGDAIPPSVNTMPEFVGFILNVLYNGDARERTGASFIIDTMIGANASSHNRPPTAGQIADWQQRLNAIAPYTLWNNNYNHTINSYWQGVQPGGTNNDDAFFNDNGSGASIIFRNASGAILYVVRRECANPAGSGSIGPLPPAPPPIVGTCAGIVVTPARPDPFEPYIITATVSFGSTGNATTALTSGDRMYVNVVGPGVNYANPNVTPLNQNGASLVASASLPATSNAGLYTVSYGITGPIGPVNCTANFPIAYQPTPKFDGDSSTGAGMNSGGVDCATPANPRGGIVSWNRGAASNYAGAGTRYAALALNYLQEFATGQGSSMAPAGLSLANNAAAGVNIASGLYGGRFAATSCTTDYFKDASGIQTGNITIGGQSIANDTHTTRYIQGNVYITGNITYSGSYPNLGAIPSYSVIVRGNIYIAPGVSQLDGLYVAEPTVAGAGGVIYTCASAPFTAAPLNSTLYNNCRATNLTVNGSFVARQVWLLRTGNSVTNGPTETFSYNPEIWLTIPPAVPSSGSSSTGKYDALTSLPPTL